MTIYTVGHSTRTVEGFVSLLREHGVDRLADVRRFPGSRKHPHFGAAVLRERLEKERIQYVHFPDLGGRRRPRADSPNTYWESASFRGYADYMAGRPFRRALDELVADARGGTTAIMCAEAVPWRCHRQLIADALTMRGVEVVHILRPGRTQRHERNSHARLQGDALVYPADQKELFR